MKGKQNTVYLCDWPCDMLEPTDDAYGYRGSGGWHMSQVEHKYYLGEMGSILGLSKIRMTSNVLIIQFHSQHT